MLRGAVSRDRPDGRRDQTGEASVAGREALTYYFGLVSSFVTARLLPNLLMPCHFQTQVVGVS
jgi:hypothetical protein